jgi:hypothetical protein
LSFTIFSFKADNYSILAPAEGGRQAVAFLGKKVIDTIAHQALNLSKENMI